MSQYLVEEAAYAALDFLGSGVVPGVVAGEPSFPSSEPVPEPQGAWWSSGSGQAAHREAERRLREMTG